MEPSDLQALLEPIEKSATRAGRLEVSMQLLEWLRAWDRQLPTEACTQLLAIITQALDKDAPRAKAA